MELKPRGRETGRKEASAPMKRDLGQTLLGRTGQGRPLWVESQESNCQATGVEGAWSSPLEGMGLAWGSEDCLQEWDLGFSAQSRER